MMSHTPSFWGFGKAERAPLPIRLNRAGRSSLARSRPRPAGERRLTRPLGPFPNPQFREVQGSESKEFIQLFPNGIQYVEGGVESAFKKARRPPRAPPPPGRARRRLRPHPALRCNLATPAL